MKIGDRYMYLPDEVVMRVNEIEDDTVFLIPTHNFLRSGKKGYPFRIDHVENESGPFKKLKQ